MTRPGAERTAWVTWSPDRVELHRSGPAGPRSDTVPAQVASDWRYQVRLGRLDDGTLRLVTGDSGGVRMWATSERGVQEVAVPTELSRCSPGRVRMSSSGRLAGWSLDGATLTIQARDDETPRTVRAPFDMVVADVTWSAGGDLWVCGSVAVGSTGVTRGWRAIACSSDGGVRWRRLQGPGGSLVAAWHRAWRGTVRSFDEVRVANGWVVLAAEPDDSADIVHVDARDPRGRWHQLTLRGDVIRAVLPLERTSVAVATHRGQVWLLHTSRRIERTTPTVLEGRATDEAMRAEVIAADSRADSWLLVVHWYRGSGSSAVRERQEIVVLHGADGEQVVTVPGPEVVTACLDVPH